MKKIVLISFVTMVLSGGCAKKATVDNRYHEQNMANDKAMQELNRM